MVIGGIQSLTPHWTLLMFAHLSPEVFLIGQQLLQIMGVIFVFKNIKLNYLGRDSSRWWRYAVRHET